MAINEDGVLVTGGDDGTLKFWDWASGYNFQNIMSQPQPGSIAAENAVFALAYDRSGTRLLTGECDKTVKMYKADEKATQ
jgi:pleiotropic regulator 1